MRIKEETEIIEGEVVEIQVSIPPRPWTPSPLEATQAEPGFEACL